MLFPLILIAFVTYLVKHNAFSKVKIGLGYILCMVATVWSTESGLFCAVAYTLALTVYFWQSDAWYSKKMWLRYAMLICGAAFSLIGAILFVNLYNLIVGGGWIFKDFFFPFGVDDYMNGVLKEDMRGGAQVWILVLLLFVALLFFGLYHTKFLRKNAEKYDSFAPVFMTIAVVGLLNFSYFANRAAYLNLDICSQLACVAMVVFADRFLGDWRDIFKKKITFARVSSAALSLLSLVVLTVLSTQIVFSTHRLASKYNAAIFDDELFEKQTQEFEEIVPEDYMVLGLGASTFNLQLGRTSEYCYRDFSDLYVGGTVVADKIVEDALDYGKVAFYIPHGHSGTTQLMERILQEGDFVLTAEGTVGDAIVKCYEKQ